MALVTYFDEACAHKACGCERADDLPGWGMVTLPMRTVDPMDDYLRAKRARGEIAERPVDERPPPVERDPTMTDAQRARFHADVFRERALLAATDPIGEFGAIAPIPQVQARQVLLEDAERRAIRPRLRVVGSASRSFDPRDLLDRLGADPQRVRGVLRCPAHEDRSASLSWRLADDGKVLLHCFAGCGFGEILAAVG